MKFFKRKKAVDAEQAPTPGDSAPDETPVTDEQVASPAPEPEVETTAVAPEPADMPGTDEKTPESAELSGTDKKTSEPAAVAGESSGFFQRLRHGLGRTSDNLVQGLGT
jgi:fused signal recognition particle receptor